LTAAATLTASSWDIPSARVIAVADSYDAMTSDRPYRPAMSVHKASHILRDGRDQQWDPAIVDAFLRCLERTPEADLSTQAVTLAATATVAAR
jgi:HD-GYP domain-containing protein (c-di-GMP phosphodiesterase class II)